MRTDHENRRILIVDDTLSIHDDFTKILAPASENTNKLNNLLNDLFPEGEEAEAQQREQEALHFELSHASQGEEAFEMVTQAEEDGNPYAMAFVDVRMPPGWDGIETISRIWARYPHVEMVICTAYSDYSWKQILVKFGTTDQLQFLRKPFDVVSVKQMALALTTKWSLTEASRKYVEDLEIEVTERTKELNDKIQEFEKAMTEIKQLQGILPMCVYCHKIRDDADYWQSVDSYIRTHTPAEISHGICPDCFKKHVEPMIAQQAEAFGENT